MRQSMRWPAVTATATATALVSLMACGQAPGEAGGLPAEVTSVLDLPATAQNYANIQLPAHFNRDFLRTVDNTPFDNPITDAGATLGRVLFYDKALSASQTVACASCHPQDHAFSDTTVRSLGFAGGLTKRNSMPVSEARYYRPGHFFWDERAATLEEQVLKPIQDSTEMGMTLPGLTSRLATLSYYQPLFQSAFGDPAVTSDRIARALAQFARSIVSYRSRFDAGMVQTGDITAPFPTFTPQENQGKGLFLGRAGCAACHLDAGPPQPGVRPNQAIFLIFRATNNGLDASTTDGDPGVGGITSASTQLGVFKSPSLRNVALTAPYMHDGRFATLEEVVEHYNSGVKPHPNLDPRLRVSPTGAIEPRRLNLTPAESASLVAFLKTLTDEELLKDGRYSDPFLSHAR
ncbi:MAG: cytochrome c peroxidase [Polyangia bacterium]